MADQTGAVCAALPMYDWPEISQATDQFWACLKDSLRSSGFPAPETLDRERKPQDIWNDPQMLLSQCCGLPYVVDLQDHVSIVGTPAYDIDCGAGSYYSVIVVQVDNETATLNDIVGARVAVNDWRSQSGYAALMFALGNCVQSVPFKEALLTGSHRQSIKAVAGGQADIASIDAVTWNIALRHEKAASRLRVLAQTDPTPGLPFICARRRDWRPERIYMAVVEAMAALNEEARQELTLMGFDQTSPADYGIIRKRFEAIGQYACTGLKSKIAES